MATIKVRFTIRGQAEDPMGPHLRLCAQPENLSACFIPSGIRFQREDRFPSPPFRLEQGAN